MTLNREDTMSQLRAAGLTYAEIGARYGISRQRVYQLLNRPTPARNPLRYLRIGRSR